MPFSSQHHNLGHEDEERLLLYQGNESAAIQTLMWCFVGFAGMYCGNDSLPLKAIIPSSIERIFDGL